MPISAKTLTAQAMQLPPDERLALMDQPLDALDEPDASLDALWAKEAESRLTTYRHGEIQAKSLSDVIAKNQADCQRYGIRRLEVFGSAALGDDFVPESSDVDFLVEFAADARPDLLPSVQALLDALDG